MRDNLRRRPIDVQVQGQRATGVLGLPRDRVSVAVQIALRRTPRCGLCATRSRAGRRRVHLLELLQVAELVDADPRFFAE